ncbi:hematopoietic prostaglandin D synthase-like [Amphiura filiformis]|uniref:hematopoietic prostaglandin D synthase-like n=1 Tax=Amphiura filiformis TaxID=82378 RepID=UPI003B2213BD
MPSYKLTYFNAKGRAEIIRLVFVQAGVKYEDVRVNFDDWPPLKPTMPTGTLPILEVDGGKKIPNCQAIARYVARECNLAGSNNLEQLKVESVMEVFLDIVNDIFPATKENDEAKKAVFEEKIKPKLKNLENMLAANGGNVFVGNKITLADIGLFNYCDVFMTKLCDDPLKDFPKLKALNEKVSKEPRIAAWLAKRPQTSL